MSICLRFFQLKSYLPKSISYQIGKNSIITGKINENNFKRKLEDLTQDVYGSIF